MQQLVRANPTPDLLSMPYHQDPDIKLNLEALPQELKDLFHKLFNSEKKKIVFSDVLPFRPKKGAVPFCHVLQSAKT